MTMRTALQEVLRIAPKATVLVQPILPLLTRLVIGHAFLVAGLGKLRHFDATVSFFASIGIPAPELNAALIATLELVGGAALVIGLATRVFAALLSSSMIVALFTAHASEVLQALNLAGSPALSDITAFVFLLFLGWLVAFGAGAFSADRILAARYGLANGDYRPAGLVRAGVTPRVASSSR